MRWRIVLNVIGIVLLFLGLSMVFPLICGFIYHDSSVYPLIKAIIITMVSGGLLFFCFKRENAFHISQREGMAIVSLSWASIGLFGALPFHFEGIFPTFADAFFESVSGFSTTGASVMTDIESMSKGILFWRSLIQWLGGMGIIVLSLAILPFLGVGGIQLYKAEVPSPVPDKLKPRLSESAMILWKVYVSITFVEVLFLLFGGMSFYDALCHALTTLPTGGFSTKNTSVAYFNSAYIDYVITFFMFLAGINFSLHYMLFKGKNPLLFWKDSECRFFILVVLGISLVVSFNLYRSVYDSFFDSIRYGLFQVVSIVTTTGYATADYEAWPAFSQAIIFFCMFIGASAGSTGGGMKCIRVMIGFKYCYRELFTLIHPRSVSQVKIAGKSIPESVIKSVIGFIVLYTGLFVICTILLSALGVDILTSLSAIASSIGNIGPGFGFVGPAENYADIPYFGKWLLAWCMLLGRLEIYTVIILIVPEFWTK